MRLVVPEIKDGPVSEVKSPDKRGAQGPSETTNQSRRISLRNNTGIVALLIRPNFRCSDSLVIRRCSGEIVTNNTRKRTIICAIIVFSSRRNKSHNWLWKQIFTYFKSI